MENNIKPISTYTLVEKRSKFIANIFEINSEEEAKEIIKFIKSKHKKAKHNVYAYIVLDTHQIISRYADDKEPHGVSKSVLFLLEQKKCQNILVIITRYFGGILLGKGGLMRAYSNSVKMALDAIK